MENQQIALIIAVILIVVLSAYILTKRPVYLAVDNKQNDAQLKPGHVVAMTASDTSEVENPPSELLCNWRQCKMGAGGGPAKALRLCPYCHRVGYCCVYCMQQDIYGHVSHECPQNIKKAPIFKVEN